MFTCIFVACTEQDLSDYIADNILYVLSASSEEMSVSPIEENHTININSNTEWSAKTSEDWIIINNQSGNSNTDLKFTTKANTTSSSRVGKIGLYYFGKHRKDIIVRQEDASIKLSQTEINCSSNNTEISVNIESNGAWRVRTEDNWIKVLKEKGVGNSVVSFSVEELFSGNSRQGCLIFESQSSVEKRVNVKQNGKYLKIENEKLSFLASGEQTENVNIETDGELVFSGENWITCNKVNGVSSISVSKNETGRSRDGKLSFSLKSVSDLEPVSIYIHQAPFITTAEAVDMGVSVKWASCNIGASSPEEIGLHYRFGETCDEEYVETNIPDCITNTDFDTATSYWGGQWRMPTLSEWKELISTCTIQIYSSGNNQTFSYTNPYTGKTHNYSVQGYCIVTSPNGNSITLPFGGEYFYRPSYANWSFYAYYRCSTHYSDGLMIDYSRATCNASFGEKYYFQSVRPVMDY